MHTILMEITAPTQEDIQEFLQVCGEIQIQSQINASHPLAGPLADSGFKHIKFKTMPEQTPEKFDIEKEIAKIADRIADEIKKKIPHIEKEQTVNVFVAFYRNVIKPLITKLFTK